MVTGLTRETKLVLPLCVCVCMCVCPYTGLGTCTVCRGV